MGLFIGDDTLADQPIKVRFHWTNPTPGQANWTQEFSHDGGASWRLNWAMDFSAG